MDLAKICSICLESKLGNFCLFNEAFGKSLPLLIENISGIQINSNCFPDANICKDCATALIQAESIIEKCRSSLSLLMQYTVKTEITEDSDHVDIKDEANINSGAAAALEETLIEIETKNFNCTNSPVDELKNSEEEKLEPELLTESARQKRKYTRKKLGRRVLKVNPKADWHFKCDQCEFESDFAAYYKNHLIEVHQVDKPKIFKCMLCSEAYQLHSSLRRHNSVVHEKQARPKRARNILCSECGKKFPCRNTLKIHMHIHTGEPLPFRCTEGECSKTFASMAALQYHITSAHKQEKKFACEICGNTFALIFSLRTHMSKCHAGNEMQDCPNCGRSYRCPKKYEEHVLSEKCKNAIHACQFPNCKKRFSRPRKMRLHMLKMHYNKDGAI